MVDNSASSAARALDPASQHASQPHIPERGRIDELFKKVLNAFLIKIPSHVFEYTHVPSAKTLADRFKREVEKRRKAVEKAKKASGIAEAHGEIEILLDDLIAEIDLKLENRRAEKEIQSVAEKQRIQAGKEIRDASLKRKNSGSAPSTSSKRAKNSETMDLEDDLTLSIMSHGAEKRKIEEKQLNISIDRLNYDKERAAKEDERFAITHAANQRRLSLDKKKFELEKEERKMALEERKQMMNVLSLLAKKLE